MTKKPTRVAIYVRVSTDEQTVANQERELRQVAEHRGWDVVEVYKDAGISGAKGRDKRPAFDRLLKDATRRRFDVIAAWSVDRLGRSLQDLIGFLTEVHAAGVDLFLHQQGLDTKTPAGRALFGMMSVFADFERAMIVERTKAGLARAKAEGKTLGRPKVDEKTAKEIVKSLKKGDLGFHKIAALHGVGTGTVQRIAKEMAN